MASTADAVSSTLVPAWAIARSRKALPVHSLAGRPPRLNDLNPTERPDEHAQRDGKRLRTPLEPMFVMSRQHLASNGQ